MCFTKEFSLAFTLLSCAIAAWVLSGTGLWKIERWRRFRISLCFFWFAFMEFLQFVQYLVLNDCSSPTNILWTAFGFVHIAFQPVFSNIALSALDSRNLRKERDSLWSFIRNLSIVGGSLMAARIILPYFVTPRDGTGTMLDICKEEVEGLCGPKTCSESGVFHLRWTFKMLKPGYAFPNISFHFIAMFVIPILMGQYLASIVLFVTGPGLALLFPGTKDGEQAAIWCFFSIAESFVTVVTQYALVRAAAGKTVSTERKVGERKEEKKKAAELVDKKTK
jgi:hypothetical protein